MQVPDGPLPVLTEGSPSGDVLAPGGRASEQWHRGSRWGLSSSQWSTVVPWAESLNANGGRSVAEHVGWAGGERR